MKSSPSTSPSISLAETTQAKETVFYDDFNLAYFYHCIETCIDEMPLLRALFPKEKLTKMCTTCCRNKSCSMVGTYIFGGFLRWLAETNGKGRLEDFVRMGGDIDVHCDDKSAFIKLMQNVMVQKGYVEFFGNQYGVSQNDDSPSKYSFSESKIDELNDFSDFPDGNYGIYVPFGEQWIKYDVTFVRTYRHGTLDFTVNGLTYPVNDFKKLQFALSDIKKRRIQPYDTTLSAKYIYRAKKLTDKGYKFDNDITLPVIVKCMRAENHVESSIFVGNTSVPSIIDGNHNVIRLTGHKHESITWESLMLDDTMKKMCDTTFVDSYLNNRLGTLAEDLIVYKAAYNQYNSTSKNVVKNVVVCLSVKKGTKYHCGTVDDGIKLRFESAFVENIYSYPDIPIENFNGEIVSSHDRTFHYKVGTIVKPTLEFTDNYGACHSGIHAFFTLECAWRYLSLSSACFTKELCKYDGNFLCQCEKTSASSTSPSSTSPTRTSPTKRSSKSPKKSPKKNAEPKTIFYNTFAPLANLKKK